MVVGFVELALRVFLPIHFTSYIGAYKYDEILGNRLKEKMMKVQPIQLYQIKIKLGLRFSFYYHNTKNFNMK